MILTEEYIRSVGRKAMDSKLNILKDLIKSEMVAHVQYLIAAESCIGQNQSYLVKHFTEHAEDELDHYRRLMTALMARNGKPDMNLDDIISRAIPTTDEMTSNLSSYLRKFFEKTESEAINAYVDFLNMIKDTDQDLADIVSGILSDERDHKLDMTRIISEDNPSLVMKGFSQPEMSDKDKLIRKFAEKGMQTSKGLKNGTVRNANAVLTDLLRGIPSEFKGDMDLRNKLVDAFKEAMD